MSKIYGIDLGTCMSSIAVIDEHDSPKMILNTEAKPLTPSAVWFDGDRTIIGQLAYEHFGTYPDQIELWVKNKMGQLTADGKPVVVEKDGRTFTPEEVSARILTELKRYTDLQETEPVKRVVITVPAYFGAAECKATMDAGVIAGLEVIETLPEPIAAALAYGFSNPQRETTLLVYDLGGGTFDLTLLKMRPPEQGSRVPKIEMITTEGNHSLGGKDWDTEIRNYWVKEFKAKFPDATDPKEDKEEYNKLYLEAEKAKRNLSDLPKTKLTGHFPGGSLTIDLTQEKLGEITGHLLDQTETCIDVLFDNVHKRHQGDPAKFPLVRPEDVDTVLMAGGSTRLKMVQEMLKRRFSARVLGFESVHPDHCVSIGAAWYGWLKEKGYEVPKQKASHAIGVWAIPPGHTESKVCPEILKDTELPAEVESWDYATRNAGDTEIHIRIYQNAAVKRDDYMTDEQSTLLGKVVISDLPSGRPAGQIVGVKMKLDEGSQLSVTAIDKATGKDATATILIGSGMGPAEIAKATKLIQSEKIGVGG